MENVDTDISMQRVKKKTSEFPKYQYKKARYRPQRGS